MLDALSPMGFACSVPQGAYYMMANIESFGFENDVEFCRHLIHDIGVAAVPGSSFFSEPDAGSQWVRFCFAKKPETIAAAAERLAKLAR
jgi:aminotransferase